MRQFLLISSVPVMLISGLHDQVAHPTLESVHDQQPSRTPRSVVEAFCREDSRGAREYLNRNEPIYNLVKWDDGEPGWDTSIISGGYKVTNVQIHGDSATVQVEYDVLGFLSGATVVTVASAPEDSSRWKRWSSRTLILVRDMGAWKITTLLTPYMSPEFLIRRLERYRSEWIEHSGEPTIYDDAIIELRRLVPPNG